jgi:hypothetical protein
MFRYHLSDGAAPDLTARDGAGWPRSVVFLLDAGASVAG